MGTSLPSTISPVLRHIMEIKKIKNVLDIGVGETGRWGFLLRDIFDGTIYGKSFSNRETWRLRIDGIEAHKPYRNFMHDNMYDKIYWDDLVKVINELSLDDSALHYDLVIFASTIEHLEKNVGMSVLGKLKTLMNPGGTLIITTPHGFSKQSGARFGNPYDYHKCGYTEKDIPPIVALGYTLIKSSITYDKRFIMRFVKK